MQEEQCFQPVLSIACIRRIRFHLDRPPGPPFSPDASCANDLLELLLGAELVGVTALLLALCDCQSMSVTGRVICYAGTDAVAERTQLTALGGRRA